MTSQQIQQTITEISARITEIDAEEVAASDSGAFDRIPSLRVEREQLGNELASLRAELSAAEQAERDEQRYDLGPRIANEYAEFHSRSVEALEAFEAAAEHLIAADAAQRKFTQWASDNLRAVGEGGPIRLGGPVPSIITGPLGRATRIESESKFLSCDVAHITERLWRALGDGAQANAMNVRKRAGTRLER
jgi:hypothetical protein